LQRIHDLSAVARRLPSPATLVLHSGCSEPPALASLLAAEAARFDGAKLYCMMPMGESPYAEEPASKHLAVTALFPGKGLRGAISAGRAAVLRHPLSAIPGLFDRREIAADAVFLQVSPADSRGRVSLGLSVDYMHAVLAQRPLVVAEINPRLPRTCGQSSIDASAIDYFLDSSELPQPVAALAGDAIDRRVAANIAALIDDGAVLQIGIGSLPDSVLEFLRDRRNLGIHSGIITDAVRPLLESGAVNNSTKQAFRGVTVTTMAAGTQEFYDFLANNDSIEFHPCSFTHDAHTLSTIDGLTAINSVLQVDLLGRANAEVVAGRVISAPGGLPDFAAGASRAVRGASIVALRSCFKETSNLVPRLAADVPTSLEAKNIDYVVTEFGAAALRGRTDRERAEALIAVAHPSHQDILQRYLAATHSRGN
jgi:4-hydroxybutyrate CoA-transferase